MEQQDALMARKRNEGGLIEHGATIDLLGEGAVNGCRKKSDYDTGKSRRSEVRKKNERGLALW